jgi:two-component system, NarL family, response regulator NreC
MPEPTTKIRIMIVDDHAIVRSGLKMLINAQPDMEVVAEAPDGTQVVQMALETKPDVALMDITMPRASGMQALQDVARRCPETRVLILSMHEDAAYLRSALAAGACGYVLKRSVDVELLAAIRAVNSGRIFVDPSLAGAVVEDLIPRKHTPHGPTNPLEILSERELQVLKLIAQGYSNQQIAERIFVSVKTVETYRSRIADKLELRQRSDMVRFALRTGLLTSEDTEH